MRTARTVPPIIDTGKAAVPNIPNPNAPNDCNPANVLPWTIAPPIAADWMPAAIDPAAMPPVVNPTVDIIVEEIVLNAAGAKAPISAENRPIWINNIKLRYL